MKVKPIFAWYDFYVGGYYDRAKKRLYIFPIPMFGIMIEANALVDRAALVTRVEDLDAENGLLGATLAAMTTSQQYSDAMQAIRDTTQTARAEMEALKIEHNAKK